MKLAAIFPVVWTLVHADSHVPRLAWVKTHATSPKPPQVRHPQVVSHSLSIPENRWYSVSFPSLSPRLFPFVTRSIRDLRIAETPTINKQVNASQ